MNNEDDITDTNVRDEDVALTFSFLQEKDEEEITSSIAITSPDHRKITTWTDNCLLTMSL